MDVPAKTPDQGSDQEGFPLADRAGGEHSPLDLSKQRTAAQRRQLTDLRVAAREIRRLLACDDYGAGGKGSRAAALGTLVKALETLHAMEADRLGAGSVRRLPVILIPVPCATMDDWQRAVGAGLAPPAPAVALPPSYRAVDDDEPEGP